MTGHQRINAPRRWPAIVHGLDPVSFHALVCAVAVRAHDDLAGQGQ